MLACLLAVRPAPHAVWPHPLQQESTGTHQRHTSLHVLHVPGPLRTPQAYLQKGLPLLIDWLSQGLADTRYYGGLPC
jgi:hypothetical protein